MLERGRNVADENGLKSTNNWQPFATCHSSFVVAIARGFKSRGLIGSAGMNYFYLIVNR